MVAFINVLMKFIFPDSFLIRTSTKKFASSIQFHRVQLQWTKKLSQAINFGMAELKWSVFIYVILLLQRFSQNYSLASRTT